MTRHSLIAFTPLIAAVLWGGMYVVSKWGFDSLPPVTLAFLRVVLGALTLLVVVRIVYPARQFSRADWTGFGFLGVWVAITMVTQFVGTDLTTASEGSIITVLTPIFTLLFGVAVLDERLTRRKIGGMALAVCGTGMVLAGRYDLGSIGVGSLSGVGLLVVASAGWAIYTVWGTSLIRRYSALETATYSTVFAVPLIALAVPIEFALSEVTLSTIPLTLPVAAAVAYLGVLSTAGAWYCWYKGLETLDASTVAVYFFAQPVVGAFFGALLLGESLGPGYVAGGVVLAVGIYIVSTA